MITAKIEKDVTEEFVNIKESLEIYLKPGFDVSQNRVFLQKHIPKEVVYKSEILLDTLLNYLMDDARKRIKTADVRLQNAFFDADFRTRFQEWAMKLENKLILTPDIVMYSSDPRLTQGLIASGITFIAGTSVTYLFASSIVGVIVGGILSILLSALAFKLAYERVTPKARECIKMDIEQYLETSQNQVSEWLKKVREVFKNDFDAFCSTNGIALDEGSK